MTYLDPTWLPTLTEILVIGGGLMFYMANWRARHKLRKVRYADMLLAELKALHDTAKPYIDDVDGAHDIEHGSIENSTEILPHNVYDGLVSSTNLSYFDRAVQDKIHSFYELVIRHNRRVEKNVPGGDMLAPAYMDREPRYLEKELLQTIDTVTEFRDKNRPNKRWRPILKLLRWYYED